MKRIILVIVFTLLVLALWGGIVLMGAGGVLLGERMGVNDALGIVVTVVVGGIVGLMALHGMSSFLAWLEEEE